MKLVLYHGAWCRSLRVRWFLEEVGVPYELITKRFSPEDLKDPEYLKLHPLGQLPVLQVDDVTLWESGAIVDFLLRTVLEAGSLVPDETDSVNLARYLQFFHFAESLMTPVNAVVAHTRDLPPGERIQQVLDAARKRLALRLGFLDREFAARGPYVLGERFSAADVMLGYSLAALDFMAPGELKPVAHGHVLEYLRAVRQRPAYKAAFDDEFNVE